MAKKERNSGLGRGLDSLIPNIAEEKEVEEGISLEDLMKDSKEMEEVEEAEAIQEETSDEENQEETESEAIQKETETETIQEDIPEEENNPEKTEKSSKNFTNVLGNDDEIVEEKSETARIDYKEELSTKTVDKLKEKSAQEEASKIQEEDSIKDILDDENIPNIEDSLSFLSKEDEKNISEIIETVEKNPRITLWSAKSAAVLRYLRKTQPEFSISKEASRLIDEAIAEEYPEIWTLFNHL